MINLTLKAEQHMKNMLVKRGTGIGIRLGVKTTGCSGLAYTLEYADQEQPSDEKFGFTGFFVLIDPKSYVYLQGMSVDYVRSGLNEGFDFKNPNEKARCGCGESFTV
jgi:iron-sulfur cluster assembly protein